MAIINNIHAIDTLIGMPVLSRVSGNKLGQVSDLIVDPIKGTLLGLMVQPADGSGRVLDYNEVFSFGQDAVMANNDNSILPLEDERLAGQPRAKKELIGVKVITEGGKLLGQVANVFVHLAPPPLALYEVRESLLDKLLGRTLFIPASAGRALSDNAERIIVPNDTPEKAADSLEGVANRHIAPLVEDETVLVQRRGNADVFHTP